MGQNPLKVGDSVKLTSQFFKYHREYGCSGIVIGTFCFDAPCCQVCWVLKSGKTHISNWRTRHLEKSVSSRLISARSQQNEKYR